MNAETILDLFLWLMLAAAFIVGAVCFAAGALMHMRFTKHTTRDVNTLNGIDLFAEHHGMQRKAGESDDDLIERVKRDNPVV